MTPKWLSETQYRTLEVLVARSGLAESTVRNYLYALNADDELETVSVKVEMCRRPVKAYRKKQ